MRTTTSRDLISSQGPSARLPFVAAKVFLDATHAGDWTNRGLHEWFDRYLVSAGWMPLPLSVSEPGAGTIPLHGPGADEPSTELARLLSIARAEIVTTLRGLLATPVDDRFLAGVIYAGRVRRRRLPGGTEWTPNPEPTAPLSAVVLSLLAADILVNRDFYEQKLTICDLCSRVVFEEGAAVRRRRCSDHPYPGSGIFPAVVRDTDGEAHDDADDTAIRG